MLALDLCSGLGGWSDGLAAEGFDVLGVEVEPRIAALYKHSVIIADIESFDATHFPHIDLIVASPPCRDFSRMNRFKHWKIPADPWGHGLDLVKACLRIIDEINPTYWLLENVNGLESYLGVPPRVRVKLSRTMTRGFWGNYPSFLMPRDYSKQKIMNIHGPLRRWERARIPLPAARALGRAVHNAIGL